MLRPGLNILILLICLSACSTTYRHCELPPRILDEVAKLKGLEKKRDVPCIQTNSLREIRELLSETIDKRLPREQIVLEGIVLKLLGVIPKGYDYRDKVISQYANQLSAFYSPEFKRFVLARDLGRTKRSVLAHELTHALQDQYYDLNKLTGVDVSTDTVLARTAVFEGDANVTMRRFVDEPYCQNSSISLAVEGLDNFKRKKSDTPLFLNLQMAFPYLVGEEFVCQKIAESRKGDRGGFNEGIRSIYLDLPDSAGQLFGFDRPEEIKIDGCLKEDSYGAIGIALLLANEVDITKSLPILKSLNGDKMCLTQTGELKHKLDWRIKVKDQKSFIKIKSMMSDYFSIHIPFLSYLVTEVGDEIRISIKDS